MTNLTDVYKIFRDKFSKEVCHGLPVKVSLCDKTNRLSIMVEVKGNTTRLETWNYNEPKLQLVRSVFDKYNDIYKNDYTVCYSAITKEECIALDSRCKAGHHSLYISLTFLG